MSKAAFLYPGQGVQAAGMGKDFYENSALSREVFDKASEALRLDMRELCFTENDRLDLTEYTQAALVTTYLAITRELESRGVHADIAAGLSLGEYAATAAAGQAKGVPFGVEAVIGYLVAKEIEFTAVRTIMSSRMAGIGGETIRERLREAYV